MPVSTSSEKKRFSLFRKPKEADIPKDAGKGEVEPENTTQRKKIIALGAGKELDKYYRFFGGLDEQIAFCVDTGTKTSAHGHPVLCPDALKHSVLEEYDIVIFSSTKYEKEQYEALLQKYSVPGERISSCRDWLGRMLEEKALYLRPSCIRIDSSTNCQLNCADCYMRRTNYGTVGKGFLKYEDFQKLLVKNPFVRSVELSNSGEPFLNPSMVQMLAFAHDMGVSVSFANGSNFNTLPKDLPEALVKYGVKSITLSIDGASQEIYEQYRVNGNFNNVIENIKLVNSLKKKYKSEFPKLTWQYILMKHNEEDAYKARNMARELGIDIKYKLDWSGTFVPKEPEKLEALTGLKAFNRSAYSEQSGKAYMSLCHQMIDQTSINWDGRVLGCCTVYQSDWGLNVFENYDLIETLNRDPYRKNVIALLTGREIDTDVPCSICRHYENVRKSGPINF